MVDMTLVLRSSAKYRMAEYLTKVDDVLGNRRRHASFAIYAMGFSVAMRSEHIPIDFELYLPRCWSDDPVRHIEANIPDEVGLQTRPELAMQMIWREKAQ
jgi:SRSO17 transposase